MASCEVVIHARYFEVVLDELIDRNVGSGSAFFTADCGGIKIDVLPCRVEHADSSTTKVNTTINNGSPASSWFIRKNFCTLSFWTNDRFENHDWSLANHALCFFRSLLSLIILFLDSIICFRSFKDIIDDLFLSLYEALYAISFNKASLRIEARRKRDTGR